jgi:hypothetical protein
MTDPRHESDPSLRSSDIGARDVVQYPENEVLAIVDTPDQVRSVVRALKASGFLDAEISVAAGQRIADALKTHTGHTGLTDFVIRVARRIGMQDEESETKDGYEAALRDDRYIVAVLAPTDARKELAAQLLASHGGCFINFLGKFSIERLG